MLKLLACLALLGAVGVTLAEDGWEFPPILQAWEEQPNVRCNNPYEHDEEVWYPKFEDDGVTIKKWKSKVKTLDLFNGTLQECQDRCFGHWNCSFITYYPFGWFKKPPDDDVEVRDKIDYHHKCALCWDLSTYDELPWPGLQPGFEQDAEKNIIDVYPPLTYRLEPAHCTFNDLYSRTRKCEEVQDPVNKCFWVGMLGWKGRQGDRGYLPHITNAYDCALECVHYTNTYYYNGNWEEDRCYGFSLKKNGLRAEEFNGVEDLNEIRGCKLQVRTKSEKKDQLYLDKRSKIYSIVCAELDGDDNFEYPYGSENNPYPEYEER